MLRTATAELHEWQRAKKRKPLIILGARQVGKTFLVKDFGRRNFSAVHTINFEVETEATAIFERNLSPDRILKELSLLSGRQINTHEDLLFFDEVQAAPRALTSLKHFHDQKPELAICAAGSLLGLHLADSSFPVGFVDWLYLYPMSFHEFINARASAQIQKEFNRALNGQEVLITAHQILWDLWREYLVCGGLPEVVAGYIDKVPGSVESFGEVRKLQRRLINDYLSDIAKHSGKVNAMHIERTWKSVPSQIAAAHDLSVGRYKFKDVVPGVHNFGRLAGPIDWLTKAGLIIQVPICERAETPISAYTKPNHFKLYMFDVGILGAMLDLPPAALMTYDFGTYKGYVAENFVAQSLKASVQEKSILGWSEGKSEIEFLLQSDHGPVPIEVKSASRIRAQSLKTFIERYQPEKSIVVSGRPFSQSLHRNGITTNINLPLYLADRINSAEFGGTATWLTVE
jgi:predicted AAA+ superfamily ATPase